jgi:HAE1 family hydrophobic/amphiphilic exporter-1
VIKAFVTRPAMTIVFVLVFVVLGIRAYNNIPTEQYPKIEFPIVSIKTVFEGASPEEIETQIVKRLEDVVAEISDIEKITAEIYENFALTLVEFKLGVDVNVKGIEVKDKVETILNDLPDAADRPEVSKFDPLVQPIVELILSSDQHTLRDLYEYADKKLSDRLSTIQGVASVDVYGGRERQINVMVDPLLMKQHYISIDEVIEALQMRNASVPGGSYDQLRDKISVRTYGEFTDVKEIADLTLVTKDNTKIQVSDIATVKDSIKEVENAARYNGKEVVGLSIMKLSDGNAVHIADRLNKELSMVNQELPKGMVLTSVYQSAEKILESRNGTLINILFGIGLTILILLLFIGKFRVTLVAAVVIPTSIISALFPMSINGLTINFATLLAIATALGTLIANALVIIEAVEQHIRKGSPPKQAAIDGTKEVTVAVLAAAGTNLCVFTPMAFMGGIVGQFMSHFGMTIIYVTIFSLIASFSLTPMMCGQLLKGKVNTESQKQGWISIVVQKMLSISNRIVGFLLQEYRRIFDFSFRHPIIIGLFGLAALVSVLYPLQYLGSDFVPSHDQNEMLVTITMPPGTNLQKTIEVTSEVERLLSALPEVKDIVSNVGSDAADEASIKVTLLHRKERERSDMDIIRGLIPAVAKIPDAEIDFNREATSAKGDSDVDIHVYGESLDDLIPIASKMKLIMAKSGFFRSVNSSYRGLKDEIRFIPDEKKLIQYDLKTAKLGKTVRSLVNGNTDNVYKEKGEEYDINVELSDAFKQNRKDIAALDILSKRGYVKLASLGKVEEISVLPNLRRRDKRSIIQISSFLQKASAGEVRAYLDAQFKGIEFPANSGYRYVGNAEHQDESSQEMGKAFILAVILTYMLLVGLMNSFGHPFVIMSSVVTSFVGVFFFLFFMEFSINIGAMMAMVMVVGLVVNNAILIIDATLQRRSEYDSLIDALWAGSEARFRTILMTSLAIVMGALPQTFDPNGAKAAIGGVVVGGMLGSIVFTLALIPITFYYFEKIRKAIGVSQNP